MKTLVNSLNRRRAAWALALCICTLFLAASSLAFSQISFEKIWEVDHPADYPIDPGFSKDGKYIYAGGHGGILQMDAATGQFIKYLDKGPFILGDTEWMVLMPDGEHAFTRNYHSGYMMWDLNLGKAIKLFPYGKNRFEKALGVTLSPDLKYLTFTILDTILPNKPLGSEDCTFYIYDIEKEQIKDSMRLWGFQGLFAYSDDGKKLISVGYKNESKQINQSDRNQKVFLWNTENWTYEVIDHIKHQDGAWLSCGFQLLFSSDNKYLSWFPENRKNVRIYNLVEKRLTAKSDSAKDCQRIVFLPDSQSYGFSYPELEIFDLKTNEPRGKLDFPIYQWGTYPQEKLLLAYGMTNEALFKMKPTSVSDNSPEAMLTASYQNGEIQVRVTRSLNSPFLLKIINLNGKELYKTERMMSDASHIRIPINLPSGFYIVKIETSSKEYSAKLEVTR